MIALSCFLLSFVAYMNSASIYFIVIANVIVYILHLFYGPRGTVAKLIYILNWIYPWLNPNPTIWSLVFAVIIIGPCLSVSWPKFRRLKIFRGLLKNTDDHVYEINGRLTHIEEHLKRMEHIEEQLKRMEQIEEQLKRMEDIEEHLNRMERMINQLQHIQQGAQD